MISDVLLSLLLYANAVSYRGLPPRPPSAIVTLVIGSDHRVFAAHEDVLRRSPYFERECRENFFANDSNRINLPAEDPETFSCVLEYLYRGDYSPRLLQSKSRGWHLDGAIPQSTRSIRLSPDEKNMSGGQQQPSTLFHTSVGDTILRDTAIYCSAATYGLPELQRLALRKQGLQSGVDVGTILRSMRYAYAHTGDQDSKLRAHFLALIVRARRTFKRSGTMQQEMIRGGEMFFDLFVALCNHLDDVSSANTSPRTI